MPVRKMVRREVTTTPDTQDKSEITRNDADGCWSSRHLKWLLDTGEQLVTVDGTAVKILELRHERDDAILSEWPKHFRNHDCSDADIDSLRAGLSRKEYLDTIKFPSRTSNLGPSIRAGDFGEILVADYLQWMLGFWVPRVRWNCKTVPVVDHEEA